MILAIIYGSAMAWLWRQGGKGNKDWRRYGAPVLSLIITHDIAVAMFIHVASRLPVTLIGDNLKIYGQLYWWIPVFCFIHVLPVMIVAAVHWYLAVFTIQFLMILGSNLANFPRWNWYEIIYGFALGVVLK